MAYNQGGYGPPGQGYGYGQPPRGHSPYPPQQGYGAPAFPPPPPGQGHPQGYGQGQYSQPPPGYPPQQQPYDAPTPGQYPPQPYQQSYGAPPSGQYPSPPQFHQQPSYGGPPQAPYGAPPSQPYGAPPSMPTRPSPGYFPTQNPQVDPTGPADGLRKAMKGFGTDEGALIRILCHFPAADIHFLKPTYQQRHHRSLEADLESETSSYFRMALLSIVRGPLHQDVWCLNKAIKGLGTKESLLNDVLIGRSNADLQAIKATYQQTYHRPLESDVRGDLSAKTERLFAMILAATRQEDSAPFIPQQIDADVTELHRATEAKIGTDQLTVCSILSNRSDGHIRAIAQAHEHKYRIPLEKVIQREFSGHMQQALVQMVRCGTDRAMRDAMLLEDTMAGPGTKDELLVCRVVATHWNREHMAQVRGAYKARFGRELVDRIRGDTSGDYERILVAMVQ